MLKFSKAVRNTVAALTLSASAPVFATTILYNQDFENPTGFVNDGGDVNIYRTVNQLYGNQPVGFVFAQAYTVETLLVGGTQAWGTGFKDPQARAGQYALGMLSDAQNDLLGLTFDIGEHKFLNFRLDISSIDLGNFGGPFVPQGGVAPKFRISLYDNPGAYPTVSGFLLDQVEIDGTVAPNPYTFDWTTYTIALDAACNTNGNVTVVIDLLQGGYAAMDNFVIAASDTQGEVDPAEVPEPGVLALLGLLGCAGLLRRRA